MKSIFLLITIYLLLFPQKVLCEHTNVYEMMINECNTRINKTITITSIYVGDNYVCFNGNIETGMKNISDTFSGKKYVIMRSGGGDVDVAIDIAEHLLSNNSDFVVWDYCLSSCANYIFMAGEKKYIPEGSFVGWHGGPIGRDAARNKNEPEEVLRALDRTKERSDDFMKTINIDKSIFSESPPGFVNQNEKNKIKLWTYDDKTMKEKFKIDGIIRKADLE